MKQKILRTLLSITLMVAPAAIQAMPDLPLAPYNPSVESTDLQSAEIGEPDLEVRGSVVQIKNAQGLKLEVYDITGKMVHQVSIDSNDKTINLSLRKGCYILKVGKLVRKVALS